MDKKEFYAGLGLPIPGEEKVEEINVPADIGEKFGLAAPKRKRRQNNPDSATNTDTATLKRELDSLTSKVQLLEERHRHNGEATNDEIAELRTAVSNVQDEKSKDEAATEELKVAKDEIAELKANLEKAREEANTKLEAMDKKLNEVMQQLEEKTKEEIAEEEDFGPILNLFYKPKE